jgi:hypothetical protein
VHRSSGFVLVICQPGGGGAESSAAWAVNSALMARSSAATSAPKFVQRNGWKAIGK